MTSLTASTSDVEPLFFSLPIFSSDEAVVPRKLSPCFDLLIFLQFNTSLLFGSVLLSSPSSDHIIDDETDNVHKWCHENKLILNASKSKCLLITRSNLHNVPTKIECVRSMKLLGLFLNNKLNWNTHIDHLRRTCSKRLHILRRLRGLVPSSSLRKIYESLIRTLLEYACPVFTGMNKKQVTILQRTHRRAEKIVCEETDLRCSIAERRWDLCLRLWTRIEKNRSHLLHQLIPHRLPRTGHYSLPVYRTNKYGNSFFPYMSRLLNSS